MRANRPHGALVCLALLVLALLVPRVTTAAARCSPSEPTAALVYHGGSLSVAQKPTVDASQIDCILRQRGSPAADTGHIWMQAGAEFGITPAVGIAFFIKESSAGTAGVPARLNTHNVGNIRAAGSSPYWKGTAARGWRSYPSWEAGIYDWFWLIRERYVNRGASTVRQIVYIYAPPSENNSALYVSQVEALVRQWKSTPPKARPKNPEPTSIPVPKPSLTPSPSSTATVAVTSTATPKATVRAASTTKPTEVPDRLPFSAVSKPTKVEDPVADWISWIVRLLSAIFS